MRNDDLIVFTQQSTHTHTHTHCTLSIMHYLLTESQFTFHPVSDTLAIVTVVSVSSVLTLVVCEPLDQNHHMHTYYQHVLLRTCVCLYTYAV